jgi:hypothetical protein
MNCGGSGGGGGTTTSTRSLTEVGVTITISPTSLPSGTNGFAYTAQLSETGSSSTITWSVSQGTLPQGLTLNSSTGLISGTPGVAGMFTFTVTATDAQQNKGSQQFILAINSPAGGPIVIMTPSLTLTATEGANDNVQLVASGGHPPFTWSISAGSLPAGLTLNSSTGVISGVATVSGTFSFTIRATDTTSAFGEAAFTLNIVGPLVITTSTLPNGDVGVAYRAQLASTGGVAPITWSLSAGSLPAGLTLTSSTGLISGTPTTTANNVALAVRATDSTGALKDQAFNLTITAGLAITTASLPNGLTGTAYNAQLAATGGTQPITWSLSSGNLPSGLSLNSSTGVISGTPTGGGQFTITVQAADASSASTQKQFSFTITGLGIVNPDLHPGVVGIPYSVLLTPIAGTAPYSFTLSSGTLPAGLAFVSSSGLILGTPTQTGQFTVTFNLMDSSNPIEQASRTYTFTINSATTTSSCAFNTYGVCGDPYEGNGPPPNQTPITSCQTISSPGNYKVTQNIGTDQTVACITITAKGVNLDLGGSVVTGAIYDTVGEGNVEYNGAITCNLNGSTYPQACLNTYNQIVNNPWRAHHLAIIQNNSNGQQLRVEMDSPQTYVGPTPTGLGMPCRIDHIYWDSSTINDINNNRYGLINNGGYCNAEEDHNYIHCTDKTYNNCEGMGCGGTFTCYLHDNYIQQDAGLGDARAIGCDLGAGVGGTCDVYNNIIIATNNRAIRMRYAFTDIPRGGAGNPQIGNIYNNTILDIQLDSREAAIHIGENDNTLQPTMINIFGNTFELETGKGIYVASASGVNAHDNVVTCFLDVCTNAGDVLHTDAFAYAATGTSATIKNTTLPAGYVSNAVIACGVPGVNAFGCTDNPTAGTSTVTYCNTGTVVGNGTIAQSCP